MNKILTKTCPICHGDKLKNYAECKDYFTSGEKFHLFQCNNCHFILTADAPNEKEIGEYYKSESYISHTNTSKGLINKVYHKVRTYMINKKANLVWSFSEVKKGKLLDVGAGIGLFVQKMKQKGWDAMGIETSKVAREYAQKQFCIELKSTNYWSQIKPYSLDVITLWHVLEHISSINEIWDKFHQALTPNGLLIIALPNCDSHDAKKYKEHWAAYDVPRHIWHFTPKTLELLAKKHHFKIIGKKTMPFDGFYIAMMSEKYKNSAYPLLKGFLTGIIGWFKSLFNASNSSSIIYILKKVD